MIGTTQGILLLAHGGPGSLEDVAPFLEHIRGGRPCSQALIDEVRERYRRIGGASPLPDITRRVAAKLESACELPVYVGMLHWHPFLEETLSLMHRDEISEALAVCLTPHFSACSVGRYRSRALPAAADAGVALHFVESWHTSPPYVQGLVDSVIAVCGQFPGAAHDRPATEARPGGAQLCGDRPGNSQPHVIFSAHSLPQASLPEGDPYESQLRETAGLVAERLGLPREGWTLAYQSASAAASDWLGPGVDEVLVDLSHQGSTRVVLCPFGFLTDQVEILYDLDIVMKQNAADLGITLSRTPLLNEGPALIDSLALLVRKWKE